MGLGRIEREIMFLEEEHDQLCRRLADLERTEPRTNEGRLFRARLRGDIEAVGRELAQARRLAEIADLADMTEEAA